MLCQFKEALKCHARVQYCPLAFELAGCGSQKDTTACVGLDVAGVEQYGGVVWYYNLKCVLPFRAVKALAFVRACGNI